jgi:hypothetical protein
MVLNQDIISTPGAEFNRGIVEHKGDNIFHPVIDLGNLGFQISERGWVIQGRVFSDIAAVIEIAKGLIEQVSFASDTEDTGDIELIVICSEGTLQWAFSPLCPFWFSMSQQPKPRISFISSMIFSQLFPPNSSP